MSITINFVAVATFISSPIGHFILAILAIPVIFAISSVWFRFIKMMFRIFFGYKVEDSIENIPIVIVTVISLAVLFIYFLKLFICVAV